MKRSNQNAVCSTFRRAVLPMAVLSVSLSAPLGAQAQGGGAQLEEIIVSARRQQESAQEVPISITVFNQEQLDNSNIFTGTDLATYTPSLSVNQRFGPDNPSFAIRGFTQELRTTASVGFYFAEVVAPRAGGSVTAGDGAGPGSFFDLQDVLVLKGPQGTLFGRNTTGGAIMLTPQEPTTELEGYIEASAGDYDMERLQGVLNVPFSDRVRGRFGIDTQTRDGYLKNVSGVGPDYLGDVDYFAARASLMVDVTDTITNYTIASYADSENNGTATRMFVCNPAQSLGTFCRLQLANQGDDFYTVNSLTEDPTSALEQWQVINTTTWAATDDITVKNILSYADLEQTLTTSVFGTNYPSPIPGLPNFYFTESGQVPGVPTNSQTSFVEEIQIQGYAFDSALTWQMGLYYENSKPDGDSGSQSGQLIACDSLGAAPANFRCQDVLRAITALSRGIPPGFIDASPIPSVGNVQRQFGTIEYTSKAVYGEATYDIADDFRVTFGLRYTEDKTEGEATQIFYTGFPSLSYGAPGVIRCVAAATAPSCQEDMEQESDAVTGLLSFDYFLTQDAMLYAKYARGYRQGSLSIFSPPGLKSYEPEQVDAFEVGAKTKFGGPVPGTFNVAIFYNELQDQQVQLGVQSPNFTPTTAVVNAGQSKIQGIEVESSLNLHPDLSLDLAYTFLDTELVEADYPQLPADITVTPAALEGGDLSFSPKHAVTASLNYRLPLPAEVGDVSAGITYVYTDSQFTTAPEFLNDHDGNPATAPQLRGTPYAELDSYDLVNLNVTWNAIMGTNFDASMFVTNVLDEEYVVYRPGQYHGIGAEFESPGQPRMWGARLRYTFGQ